MNYSLVLCDSAVKGERFTTKLYLTWNNAKDELLGAAETSQGWAKHGKRIDQSKVLMTWSHEPSKRELFAARCGFRLLEA